MIRWIRENQQAIEDWIEQTYRKLAVPVLVGALFVNLGMVIGIYVVEMAEGSPAVKDVDSNVLLMTNIHVLMLFIGSTICGLVVGNSDVIGADIWSSLCAMFLTSNITGLLAIAIAGNHGVTWSFASKVTIYLIWWAYMLVVGSYYFVLIKWNEGWRPGWPKQRPMPQGN